MYIQLNQLDTLKNSSYSGMSVLFMCPRHQFNPTNATHILFGAPHVEFRAPHVEFRAPQFEVRKKGVFLNTSSPDYHDGVHLCGHF